MSRIRGWLPGALSAGILLVLFLTATGAPAPVPALRIESVAFSVRNPLRAGARLPVSVRATGGGAATFHVFGVATDIGMRELRTAGYQGLMTQYAGTYVVRPGDAVRNGAVFATLSGRGTTVMAASPQRLTVDTRPPRVGTRYPVPGARLANVRPNIAIEVVDLESGVDPASVRLTVNGQNVTARASISDALITYNPAAPFGPGPVRVELAAADRAGNALRAAWGFDIVASPGPIASVTVNPATVLVPDDVLTVVVAGVPAGRAFFSIEGVRGDRPMKESQTPGIYFGTFVVPRQLAVSGGVLTATVEKGGQRSAVPASVPITVLAGTPPPAPTIDNRVRAVALDDPDARLTLNGTSRPGFRIVGRIDYAAASPAFEGSGTLGEFTAVVAANGTWRTTFNSLVPLPEARLTITVIAVDPAGRRSPPATLEVISS